MKSIAFVLGSIHRYSRTIIPFAAMVAVVEAVQPFAGIFLPMIALDLLISKAAAPQAIAIIGGFTLLLLGLYFLSDFCARAWGWRRNYINQGISFDLHRKNLECEYSYLENPDNQALYARLQQNIDDAPNSCFWNTIQSLIGFVTGILGFTLFSLVLSGLNVWIILLLTATATANYFVIRAANRYEHRNKDNWAQTDRKIAYLLRVTGDYEHGKDIRIYNMKPWFVSIANSLFYERSQWDSKVQNRHFLAKAGNALTVVIRDGAAYAFLIYMVVQGNVSIPEFILYFGAISGFSGFVTAVMQNITSLGGALPYIADIRKYLDGGSAAEPASPLPSEEKGKATAKSDAPTETSSHPVIEFRNVSFSYTPEQKVLDGISFTIGHGEKIAIVGINGAGKTTLVKLICGFYQPDAGDIYIYGENINRYRKEELMKLYSVVFQDEFILPFSIAENVTVNHEDEAGIQRSLELAGLWNYVSRLPDGLKTRMTKKVRDEGIILSGGQNQKLFLARALYKDAPILILDEPTAMLDPIAESEIYEKYHGFTEGKASIFISHRLASTRFCDRILLINEGRITETGSHDELMSQGGEYANMYDIQSHYYKEGGEERES